MKLEIGPGDQPTPGMDFYCDRVYHPNIPKHLFREWDLTDVWPWKPDTFSFIRASHAVEHLPDPIHAMNEAWRILKPEGLFEIVVPSTEGASAFGDPTHLSFWNRRTFDHFLVTHPLREQHRELYGIKAAFEVVKEEKKSWDVPYPSGPLKFVHLSITLKAVK